MEVKIERGFYILSSYNDYVVCLIQMVVMYTLSKG